MTPQFWKQFHDHHWQPRVPTVLRRSFKPFPFSETLVLEALKTYEADLRRGDQRKPCLVSIGDKERPPHGPLEKLFKQKIESLADLEKACAKVFPKKRFGWMVTQSQAMDPRIWRAVTAFLTEAGPWIGAPLRRAFLDFFYGNYSTEFTGVHKDTQEIIAFVVRGKKRILAWPFNYFVGKLDGVGPGDKFFNKRLTVDYRKYRKDALILEAEAGDVFYWPADYWHVSETVDGQFSAMLSLGIYRPETPAGPVTKVPDGPDAARHLRWLTSFGYELGGPLAEEGFFDGKTTVTKERSRLILWKTDRARRRTLVASGGHSLSLPYSSRLIRLIEKISRGEPVTVSDGSAGRATFFETNWNLEAELKTRKITSRRSPEAHLVDWLLRVYAVTAESPPSSRASKIGEGKSSTRRPRPRKAPRRKR